MGGFDATDSPQKRKISSVRSLLLNDSACGLHNPTVLTGLLLGTEISRQKLLQALTTAAENSFLPANCAQEMAFGVPPRN